MTVTYIRQISGVPGSGNAKTVFTNGMVSTDLKVSQFFMIMQDKGYSVDQVRSTINIGRMCNQDVDWNEVDRILSKPFKVRKK